MARHLPKQINYILLAALVLLLGFAALKFFPKNLVNLTLGSPLVSAYEKMYQSDGVIGKSSVTGAPSSTSFEFQPPNILHTTVNMGPKTFETIATPGSVYTRDGSGPWMKTNTVKSTGPAFLPTQEELTKVKDRENNKDNFTLEKTANCPAQDGNCRVYKEKIDADQTHRYYINDRGFLVRDETYFKESISGWNDFEYQKVSITIPTDFKEFAPPVSKVDTSTIPQEVKDQIEKMQAEGGDPRP